MQALIFKFVGLTLVTAVLGLILRQRSPEQAFMLTVGFAAVSGVYLLSEAAALLGDFLDFANSAVEESFQVVVKSLGICLVTQMACDTCCDFGQTALAGRLELAAKVAILAVSFPLFRQLFALIERLL